MEEEREACCDELVLQFGYDKVGYASALLTLEKLSARQELLALGATGKHYLLSRIEKIVGMEKKKVFRKNQFAGILAALFCIMVFHSVLIIRENDRREDAYAYRNLNNPLTFFANDDLRGEQPAEATVVPEEKGWAVIDAHPASEASEADATMPMIERTEFDEPHNSITSHPAFMQVELDEIEVSLTAEQKQKVASTVAATKKVMNNLQWKEVEDNHIADAMNENEKRQAREEYLAALDESMNWKNIEKNMKAQYENIDWKKINGNVNRAMTMIQLDSLQENYSAILVQLDKMNAQISQLESCNANPLPDQSVEEIRKSREVLRNKLQRIKAIRSPRKIVQL
jgi:hypothetical protein